MKREGRVVGSDGFTGAERVFYAALLRVRKNLPRWEEGFIYSREIFRCKEKIVR